ncbi:hypothetical protein Q8A73_009390 [Channa argus]|nr:hypothetical protein Q8A73_009390 [Channa argus]
MEQDRCLFLSTDLQSCEEKPSSLNAGANIQVSRCHLELCGMTLMAVGTVVGVNRSSLLQLLGPFSSQSVQFINVGFFCIAIGALLLVLLGLLGFCGAHKESRCLLLTFSSIILIMFFAEVAAAVVARYGTDAVLTKIWNSTMTELRCCGFTNYTDFVGSTFEKENGGVLPSSCCRTNSTTCSRDDAALSGVQGCCKLILQIIKDHGNIMGSVAAGIGLLEIASVTVSMYLYCHLDNTIG